MKGWHGSRDALLHLFLLLHPPVLEPDLDLRFVQSQHGGDFYSPCPREVLVEMKFLLEFCKLFVGEVGPAVVSSTDTP